MINLLSAQIKVWQILLPAAILLVLGVVFALLLAYLGNRLAVKRDKRIDEVAKYLSGANCGGCGYAGCDAFATAVVEGRAKVTECPSTAAERKQKILELLGSDGEVGEETVAVVRCNGGNFCQDKYEYQGYGNCKSQELLAGGRKACPVGCMGMGTCVDVCPYNAVQVGMEGYAVVNREKCTSCGKCIAECPKKLIARIPRSAAIFVACSNNCKGKDVREICTHGCIGCTMCAKVCPSGAITMENNLPKIDYNKCVKCFACVAKCPTHVIKRIDKKESPLLSDAADDGEEKTK